MSSGFWFTVFPLLLGIGIGFVVGYVIGRLRGGRTVI